MQIFQKQIACDKSNLVTKKNRLTATRNAAAIFALSLCLTCLAGCKSPEQKRLERQTHLEKFCTSVVQHLLDRNPDTIRASITHLQREELPDPVFDKLQEQGLLPKTELGILRIIDRAQEIHSSNEVQVKTVKPIGPIEKDLVPFTVSGVEINKTQGKPDESSPFSCTITCKMNDETGDYPQAIQITGLSQQVKPATKTDSKEQHSKKRHHK